MRAGRSWLKVLERLPPMLFSVLVLSLLSELKRGAGGGERESATRALG